MRHRLVVQVMGVANTYVKTYRLCVATPTLVVSCFAVWGKHLDNSISNTRHYFSYLWSWISHLACSDALLRAKLLHIAVQQKEFRRIRGEPALPVHLRPLWRSLDQTSRNETAATAYNFARYLTKFISLQPLLYCTDLISNQPPTKVYPPISAQTIGSCFFRKVLRLIAVTSSNSRFLLSRTFQCCLCLRVSSRLACIIAFKLMTSNLVIFVHVENRWRNCRSSS